MIESAALILFPALMAFAASSDLLTMTISNRISLGLVAGFLILAVAAGLPLDEIMFSLSCGLVVLMITFGLFCVGWIGGGDAKLAAATAVWLGWGQVLDYGLVSSAFGGVLTLVLIQMRRWPMPAFLLKQTWFARLYDTKSGIPYGIALAAAGLVVYPHTPLWLKAVGV